MEPIKLTSDPGLNEWNLILAYRGSISFNTYIPNNDDINDIDLIGICIPSLDYYFGLKNYHSNGTKEIRDGNLDIVIFEFKKLIYMLSGSNPNVISLLWTLPEHFIHIHSAAKLLIENRDLFLSKTIYHKFAGYANSQLKGIQKDTFNGKMGEKRKALVERFGIDVKNASHLIRLLRMCNEILRTGQVNVWREDREELVAIRSGEWSLEKILEESDKLFKLCEEAYSETKLPERVDMDKISKLSVDVILEFMKGKF